MFEDVSWAVMSIRRVPGSSWHLAFVRTVVSIMLVFVVWVVPLWVTTVLVLSVLIG